MPRGKKKVEEVVEDKVIAPEPVLMSENMPASEPAFETIAEEIPAGSKGEFGSRIKSLLGGRGKYLIWIAVLILILLLVWPSREERQEKEFKKLSAEVNKVYLLPGDEVPQVAVLSDLAPVAGQPFFARAEVGDVVLLYPNLKRVVLWRPHAKQIVEISALDDNPQ